MNIFQYIKERVDLLKLLKDHGLKNKTRYHIYDENQLQQWSSCPFEKTKCSEECQHNQLTISATGKRKYSSEFRVNKIRKIFYCFHCHTGGDAITYIAKFNKSSPLDAAKYLINRYKIKVPDELII